MMHLKTYEEQKALAARMNLMDDQFFQKIAEDRQVCEELLQILLDQPDLTIIESHTQLPDLYSVFISEIDPFQLSYSTYHVRRSLAETDTTVQNGVHEIYVNAASKDGTATAELMQYFMNSNGYNEHFAKISQRVMQLKETNEGVREMTSVFDEYADEVYAERIIEHDKEIAQKTAINFIKNGAPIEMIALSIPSLSLATLQQMKDRLETKVII